MKNFHKVKALERLYAELGKSEMEHAGLNNYATLQYQVSLLMQDIPPILDVLAQAIAEERK